MFRPRIPRYQRQKGCIGVMCIMVELSSCRSTTGETWKIIEKISFKGRISGYRSGKCPETKTWSKSLGQTWSGLVVYAKKNIISIWWPLPRHGSKTKQLPSHHLLGLSHGRSASHIPSPRPATTMPRQGAVPRIAVDIAKRRSGTRSDSAPPQ